MRTTHTVFSIAFVLILSGCQAASLLAPVNGDACIDAFNNTNALYVESKVGGRPLWKKLAPHENGAHYIPLGDDHRAEVDLLVRVKDDQGNIVNSRKFDLRFSSYRSQKSCSILSVDDGNEVRISFEY